MKKGINLSSEHKKNGGTTKRIFSVMITIFVITVVAAITLISYKSFLAWSLGQASQKEQDISIRLAPIKLKKEKFLDIHTRLKDIKSILVNRSKITTKVNEVAGVVPAGASLLSANGKEEVVSLGIHSEDLSVLNDLIEQKIISVALDKKKGIKKIEVKSFILNPRTLSYDVNIVVTFN